MKRTEIMVVGLGLMGRMVLENLVRVPGLSKIVVADVNEENGIRVMNRTSYSMEVMPQ